MTHTKEDNLPLGVALKKSFISHEIWSKYYISSKNHIKGPKGNQGEGEHTLSTIAYDLKGENF